jgi:hypothetical protein
MNASRTASNRAVLAGLLLAGGSLLAGCGGGTAAQILGVGQTTPDEFAVAPSAPLAMPATLDSLPVPQPGAPRPQEGPLYLQAQDALFNGGQPGSAGGRPTVTAAAAAPTAADTAILARAGGGASDPTLRATIDSEEDTTAQANRSQLEAIFGASHAAGGTVLDPQAEAARIRAAQASGAPLTQGETEILPPKPKGWLETIFDW